MKKLLLLSTVCLSLISCQQVKYSDIAYGKPIMPLHRSDATEQTVYLTDYTPALTNIDSVSAQGYTIEATGVEDVYTLSGGNNMSVLRIWKDGMLTEVPIIANKPFRSGVTTISAHDYSITFCLPFTIGEPQIHAYWQNIQISDKAIKLNSDSTYTLTIPNEFCRKGRSFVRVFVCDDLSRFNDLLVPLQDGKPVRDAQELTRHDINAQVLYSLMIDRFQNGDSTNDRRLNSPDVLPIVDYMGGDIAGITQQIEKGFFDSLGISTIWISPITQNPNDAWGQYHNPETRFSGYHGYWPIYVTVIDDRFGNDQQLKQLLSTAHRHNINVILDYVANHIHISSPIMKAHPDWVTDSIITLPDGTQKRNFELWDEARLTTWFDVHIPTLDLEREEVYQPMTDSALYWLENYDFDGFRHDACKHIPECYWRTLTKKINQRFPDRDLWMIGETYGSPELISSYVKTGMLDAQFDFNVYHTAIDVIGNRPNHSMEEIAHVVEESQAVYGAHHTMGNISGNHDKARFISLAGGALDWDEDHKQAGWNRTITVGDTAVAYRRAMLLEILNFGIPGVPCIYQGDEYGQPGGNDPDNRHMMRFSDYNEQEQQFRNTMADLIHMRREELPLIYGDYRTLFVNNDVYVFSRTYMGETYIFALNRADQANRIELKFNGKDINLDLKPIDYQIIYVNEQ